jgi:hypothetical protein
MEKMAVFTKNEKEYTDEAYCRKSYGMALDDAELKSISKDLE